MVSFNDMVELRKIIRKKEEEAKTTEEVHKGLVRKPRMESKVLHGARVRTKRFFSLHGIDSPLLVAVILVTLFGLFMIYDASSIIAYRDFHDKYHYIKDQLIWFVLGMGSMYFFSVFGYKRLQSLALMMLLAAIGLLMLVFIPGIGVHVLGARRWVNLGLFVLQPAEFVKLSLAIYLAAWFTVREKGRLPAFAMLMGFLLLLIMLEPDMGTASIVLFEALVAYFLSGAELVQFAIGLPVVFAGGLLLTVLQPYRMARLTSYLHLGPSLDGASYHVKQILIALGSGGLFGVGLGNSLQKYAYLPENVTDSIFAIVAEELGFFGSVVLILAFFFIIWRGFLIASQTKDAFGKILAATIISFLGIQVVINLGAMTALLPLTGVPLPFVSYGGSALVIDMSCIGILLNISKSS